MPTHSILLLDSNPDTAEMYAAGLRMAGFRPVIANDGPDAREHIRLERPDAVVAELVDAAGDGWGFVRQLRVDAVTRGIPVFVLTGARAGSLMATVDELECAVLMTPCLPDALAAVLQCVLDPRAGEAAAFRRLS